MCACISYFINAFLFLKFDVLKYKICINILTSVVVSDFFFFEEQ